MEQQQQQQRQRLDEDSLERHASQTVLVSLCYYAGTMLLGRCLRSALSAGLSRHRGSAWLTPYALDLVTSLQTCACSLENGTLRKQYGMPAYVCVLFTVGYWNSLSLPGGCAGNPCKNWRRFARGDSRLGQALGRMACQLIGGQVAFRYATAAWSLGLCRMHVRRLLAASGGCSTDLTVSLAFGFCLEFLGVFGDSLLLAVMAWSGLAWLRLAEVQRALIVLLGTVLTYYGLFLTGMYANPANASAQTLGCEGTALWEHALVYWVAPLLGVSLGRRFEGRFVDNS